MTTKFIIFTVCLAIGFSVHHCWPKQPKAVYSIPVNNIFTNITAIEKTENLVESTASDVLFSGGCDRNYWMTIIPNDKKYPHAYHWTNIVIPLTKEPTVTRSNGYWWVEFKKKDISPKHTEDWKTVSWTNIVIKPPKDTVTHSNGTWWVEFNNN
jgi:hypothetical protein